MIFLFFNFMDPFIMLIFYIFIITFNLESLAPASSNVKIQFLAQEGSRNTYLLSVQKDKLCQIRFSENWNRHQKLYLSQNYYHMLYFSSYSSEKALEEIFGLGNNLCFVAMDPFFSKHNYYSSFYLTNLNHFKESGIAPHLMRIPLRNKNDVGNFPGWFSSYSQALSSFSPEDTIDSDETWEAFVKKDEAEIHRHLIYHTSRAGQQILQSGFILSYYSKQRTSKSNFRPSICFTQLAPEVSYIFSCFRVGSPMNNLLPMALGVDLEKFLDPIIAYHENLKKGGLDLISIGGRQMKGPLYWGSLSLMVFLDKLFLKDCLQAIYLSSEYFSEEGVAPLKYCIENLSPFIPEGVEVYYIGVDSTRLFPLFFRKKGSLQKKESMFFDLNHEQIKERCISEMNQNISDFYPYKQESFELGHLISVKSENGSGCIQQFA